MPELFTDAQSAAGFVVSQTQNIETEVYKIKYPAFNYADFVPVVTEGSPWASGTTFYTMDIVGKTEWLGNEANDIPYTDLLRDTGSAPYYARGGAYRWSLMELNRAAMLGISLGTEKASGTRSVMERFLFDLAITGDTEKSMKGLINYTGVTAGDVAANGSDSLNTAWSGKDADEIIADIRIGFDAIRTATGQVFTPDTLAVPPNLYSLLATRRISSGGDGVMSILDYISTVFGKAYKTPFTVESLRQLTGADPGGDGRALLYAKTREVVRFHLPRPFQFQPVFQKNSLEWEQVGFAVTGGTEVRVPKAMIYMDGVQDDTP